MADPFGYITRLREAYPDAKVEYRVIKNYESRVYVILTLGKGEPYVHPFGVNTVPILVRTVSGCIQVVYFLGALKEEVII